MIKEYKYRKIVDLFILTNIYSINERKSKNFYIWQELAPEICNENNLANNEINNDYVCRRFQCISNKIKKGKTIEKLINELILPPLSLSERRKLYSQKYLNSDKGKATKEKISKNPWHVRNREYRKIKDKEYREKNRDKEKIRSRKQQIKLYGLTEDDYNRMFLEQEERCAICNAHQSEFEKSFHIDHCHKTNKVRGLLCRNCNVGLGHFKDSIELMDKAINYLNKNK
jgi:hypothetical protein